MTNGRSRWFTSKEIQTISCHMKKFSILVVIKAKQIQKKAVPRESWLEQTEPWTDLTGEWTWCVAIILSLRWQKEVKWFQSLLLSPKIEASSWYCLTPPPIQQAFCSKNLKSVYLFLLVLDYTDNLICLFWLQPKNWSLLDPGFQTFSSVADWRLRLSLS